MMKLVYDGRDVVLPSPRETQVLRLTAEGCSNKQIAFELRIKECTVKKVKEQMRDALGGFNTAQLIAWAVSQPQVFERQAVSPAPYRVVARAVPIRRESRPPRRDALVA